MAMRILPVLYLLLLQAFLPGQRSDEVLRVIAMPTSGDLRDAGRPMGIDIDPPFLREWRHLRDRALSEGVTTLVLEIHTPGGYVDVAKEILNDLRHLRDFNGVRTVAYVPEDATSAGAIIALGCRELAMAPGATIGNIIPLALKGLGLIEEAPRKLVSDIVGLMKGIAQTGGFDQLLLESMVDPERDVWAAWSDGTVQILDASDYQRISRDRRERGLPVSGVQLSPRGQAYVFAAGQQVIPGFERAFPYINCSVREDLPQALGIRTTPLRSEEVLRVPVPAADFYRAIFAQINWSVIFLILGIVFFVMEFKTPGLGIFGVLGVLSLIVYFWVNSGEGLPVAFSLGLLALGFMLLLAEFFIIPGFGIAGIAGAALILFSIYASTMDLGGDSIRERLIPDTPADWLVVKAWLAKLTGATVLGIAGAILLIRNLHHIPIINQAFLSPPEGVLHDSGGVTASGRTRIERGTRGTALTVLRPSGKARFSAGDVDVVSDGGYIQAGTEIEVVLIEGHRVVVRPRNPHP